MFWFCGDRRSRRLLSKSCFHIYWNSQSEKSPPAASGLPSGLEAAVPASSSQNLLWCLNLLSCWKRRRAKSFIFNFSFSISMFLLRAHAAFRSRGTRWGWLSINRKLLNNILSHFCKTKITKWSWFNWLVEKKLYSLINNLNIHLIPMRLKSWTVISPPPRCTWTQHQAFTLSQQHLCALNSDSQAERSFGSLWGWTRGPAALQGGSDGFGLNDDVVSCFVQMFSCFSSSSSSCVSPAAVTGSCDGGVTWPRGVFQRTFHCFYAEDKQTFSQFLSFNIFSLCLIFLLRNCIKDLNTAVWRVELSLSALNKYFNLTLWLMLMLFVAAGCLTHEGVFFFSTTYLYLWETRQWCDDDL